VIITYHGAGMVKLQAGEAVTVFNPINKDAGAKAPRFGADLALVAVDHEAYNGAENMSFGERSPFVIDGPGEYEVAGSFIRGLPSAGPDGLINTIYTLTIDNLKVCHLGALSVSELADETIEAIGVVDLLFTPVGGHGTVSPVEAHKLAELLTPKLVIPVEWADESELKAFLKEAGESAPLRSDRLTLKRRDVEGKEGEVAVIDRS
jgi:L-ascorbate metabolism protein UlaG (beta-lactamase superfamily)